MDTRAATDTVGRERMWKLVVTITGVLGALLAKRLMRLGFQAVRKDAKAASPFDPTSPDFSWPDVILWAVAAGVGLGVAKVLSARLAVFSWEAATGTRPPGFGDAPTLSDPG